MRVFPAAAQNLKHDFVYGYLQVIDGERDPRNLLTIFALTPKILRTVSGWQRFVEELFDVTSCYYPISFTPKKGDIITSEMLSEALDAAMTCVPEYAGLFCTFILDKLRNATDDEAET